MRELRCKLLVVVGLAALLAGLGCGAAAGAAGQHSLELSRDRIGIPTAVITANAERGGSAGAPSLRAPAELWEFWALLLSLTQSRLPPQPTLFSASTAPAGAVGLGWGTGPGDIAKWEYRRRPEDGIWSAWTEIADADAATATHTVSSLGQGVRYKFQLRAVNANGPGPTSATVSAVAGLVPPTPSEPSKSDERAEGPVSPPTLYSAISLTSEAAHANTYAFLRDINDLSSGATSLAEMDTAEALLINTGGRVIDDYGEILDTVAGERLMWFPGRLDGSCWYAYRVVEVLPDPPAPPRKLFRIELEAKDPCEFTLVPDHAQDRSDPHYDGYYPIFTSFGRGALPRDPYPAHIGPDGIRGFPPPRPQGMGGYPVESGRTYRLGSGISWSSILIDVPEEAALSLYNEGVDYAIYLDEASNAYLRLNPFTGKDAEYYVWTDGERAEPPAAAVARFEAIIASIRVSPLPGPQHRAGAPTLAARAAASGSVALSWSPGPADARRWEYRQRPEGGGWGAWTRIAGSNVLTASHTVTGLIQDARYSFQVRAANARASGPGSAAASAVAGLTPTVVSDFEPLLYHRLQSADGAMRGSSYAFLTDADDLTSGATTFAETSGAVALLINTEGYGGRDYTAALATVQAGDLIKWIRNNDNFDFDCRYDYRVIKALPDPPEPARRLFRIALEDESQCNISAAQRNDPNYFNRVRGNVAAFDLEDPTPYVGTDGVRLMSYEIEGGHTYRMVGFGKPTSIVVDVPAGMRLTYRGGIMYTDGRLTETFVDEISGWAITLSPFHVWDADYSAPTPDGRADGPADVIARFEALIHSIRVSPLP